MFIQVLRKIDRCFVKILGNLDFTLNRAYFSFLSIINLNKFDNRFIIFGNDDLFTLDCFLNQLRQESLCLMDIYLDHYDIILDSITYLAKVKIIRY